MLCVMQTWTSPEKHWSCCDILRAPDLSKSHLKHPFYKTENSSVRSEGNRSKVGEQPTWRTTASLWPCLNQPLIRSSCKQSKVVFPNTVWLQSFYPLLKKNQRTS